MKNQSWAVLGAQGRFRNASRHAEDGFWTLTCRPKADPGTRARQERPRVAQWQPPSVSETLQKLLGRLPRRPLALFASPNEVGSVCGSIFNRFRSSRGSSEVRFVSLLPVFYRCRTLCASNACRTHKPRKNSRFGVQNQGSGRPGGHRASKFGRQNGQDERKCASEVPLGLPKIFKLVRTRQLRARKRATRAENPKNASAPCEYYFRNLRMD